MVVYFLIKLWPLTNLPQEKTTCLWGDVWLPIDTRLILVAAVAGALGAYVHLATSFADFAGNQQLAASWVWWYVFRPFIGMALAEVLYLAVRGGILDASAGTTASVVSPYGVAAICALTGLFSKQATDKLREVFETLFRTQQKVERKDSLPVVNSAQPTTDGSRAQAKSAGSSRTFPGTIIGHYNRDS